MKKIIRLTFGVISLVLIFNACTEDSSVGLSIRPQQDKIVLGVDTFHVESSDYFIPAISAQSDTMMLGKVYNSIYGTLKSELLVQLAPPVNYEFPSAAYNPQPDSLVLKMYYATWFGSSVSPLQISIYEMNKNPIYYSASYSSDFNVSDFCDSSILMGKSIVTSIDQTLTDSLVDTTLAAGNYFVIRYKFDNTQLQRFYNIPHNDYTSIDRFLNDFKGMYITTTYGSSTMLNVAYINLLLYYHYTYNNSGKDTTMSTYINYPANADVRQLNKFIHPDRETVIKERDSVNHIIATGGSYPIVKIPLGRMRKTIKDSIGNRLLNLNTANLVVEATEIDSTGSDMSMTIPPYLLLIPKDTLNYFIKHNELPSTYDSTYVMATYSSTTKAYTFNLSYFLTKNLRRNMNNFDETMEMVLVPVDVAYTTTSSSTAITRIHPRTKMAAVTIRSGQNTYSPMRIKLIYNGF